MAVFKWSDAFYFIGAMGCMSHYSLRVQARPSSRPLVGGGIGSAGAVRPAYRQLIRHLARQLLRLWWLTRFTEGWWHLRARIAGRTLRRRLGRLSRCRRGYLRRFNRHHISRSFDSRCDNGDDRIRFPRDPKMEPAAGYAGAWQTASILWPSGSSTNAP